MKKKLRKPSVKQRIDLIDQYFDSKVNDLERVISKAKEESAQVMIRKFERAELERDVYKEQFNILRKRLADLLSPEQKDATDISKCSYEDYFIEWFKVCKEEKEAEKWKLPIITPPKGIV